MFEEGVAKEKILGFEGLMDGQPEGKEEEWTTATLARLIASKGFLRKDLIVDTDAEQARRVHEMEEMRKKITRGIMENLDDDFNLDDDED